MSQTITRNKSGCGFKGNLLHSLEQSKIQATSITAGSCLFYLLLKTDSTSLDTLFPYLTIFIFLMKTFTVRHPTNKKLHLCFCAQGQLDYI